MDMELFMECEEEELEPWQQVDDSVEEDDMDFVDGYGEPVEDSRSPPPAPETPPPRTPSPVPPAPAVSSHVHIMSSTVAPPPPRLPVASSPVAPPLVAQAPPIILTQATGGAFLLPAAPGTGNARPILLTTQGFPVQTMMNHGTPLLLNLQPGQTVQPLTLIQSPSLGQLVRPSVGVSPILPQGQAAQTRPTPVSSGHAQPGSTFTAMQLPATLTIRTSTPGPVNLQMTQLSGTNSLKLAVSPALPSGSANGVTRFTPIRSVWSSAPAPGLGPGPGPTCSSMTSSLTPDPTRVVMSVEEFYYGTFQGDLSLRRPHPLGIKTSTFTCQICTHLAENNLRLMQHMLQHSELISGGGDDWKCCRFCYRQFSSPAQLQSHQDLVHGSTMSPALCRICEWAFENEPAFLNHMKSNHKPGEMPYVCQVCSYRSSFYSDVLQHFASFHRDSRFLLCVFCLKVTRNPASYQQHLLRHQINQAFHCNKCRLQFVFLKDKMQHKLESHRSFRRPAKLEGLRPGSKVTIRAYGKGRPLVTTAGSRLLQSPAFIVQPIIIKTELKMFPLQRNAAVNKSPRSLTKRLLRGHNRSWSCDRLLCLECGTDASDFSSHYPTYVHCLLCPYSSCCSRAYATHMIHHHVPPSEDRLVPLHRRPPPCPFLLRCSQCDFRPQTADHMAAHLLVHPEHHSAICCTRTFVEPDIQFCYSEDQEPDHSKDFPDPSWRSADSWKAPAESQESSIIPFTETSGPNHNLSKNSDAIDFFNLVFPAELIKLITDETNAHAKTSRFLGSCCPGWVPVTTHEIRGFIGLVVLMGIQNLPDPQHYWSWSHYDNSYTFCRAMSFKRFKQIAANIRMGSFATNEFRGTSDARDPLHIFRPMLDILGRAMWDAYRPNCCLTIDRALLPSLEEGNPKTQPQVWLLCDSKSGYCHRFFIQVVENVIQAPGFTVVPELVKGLEDKHHQLFLANSLTSVPLMQKLLDQGIYASSSFPPPNPILPRELWDEGWLEKPGDFLQRQYGPLLATRWRDTKEMGCLATNAAPGEPDTVWRRSQTKVGGLDPIDRPMAFRLLQENMRGVDICKQLLACNPLGGIPLDRHWRSLFWFLVNLSIVNAFILLRESRKENPPAWVQDGLFSQVNFRKRLGNQLAKCAQKYVETMEIASARKTRVEVAGEAVKQRHRMSKISCISKRCKNCNKNNVRHESVYGCVICKVNLCKQPSCFWEYHGLSPLNRGSTKVGFLKDTISGAMEVDKIEGNVDEDMAPVEDTDFSDEEKLDDLDGAEETMDPAFKEGLHKDVKQPVSLSPLTTNDQLASRDREDVLTARQLRIGLVALCGGLRQASRVFSTDTRLIQSWLKEAQKRLKQTEPQHKVDVGGEERLVAWVLSMREQQLPITESNLFHKASTLKKKGGFSDSFRISYDWAVSFLLQHRLWVRDVSRCTSLLHSLPPSLEPKVKSFREFTQNVLQVHGLTESSVAAMDELCLFLDVRLAQDESRRLEALELSGSVPLVTVFLAALADGTMLKSLVLASRDLEQKARPEFIILGTAPDLLPGEEVLDLWTKQVWLPHVSGPGQPTKSMLVLDRHREHMGDRFLASISGSGTLPAMIPGGCSVLLQPLEVCVKPVLQHYLISRWSTFTRRNPKKLEELSPQKLLTNVAQLLVDWLEEALTHLNKVPQLWRKCFNLTGLLRKTEEEEEEVTSEKPEKIQSDLMKTLTEILMDSETLQVDPSDLLELEDEEDEAHEQQGGQEPETSGDKRREAETSGDKRREAETSGDKRREAETSGDKRREAETPEKRQENSSKEKEIGDRQEIEEEGGTEDKENKVEETEKDGEEDRMDSGEKEEMKTLEEDSEEEGGKLTEEDIRERRETRIVIGEDVGDEWKIVMKS